jgi:class 3 adenylate cyclase/tetratricopeptide (TPR) repeat protein
MAACPQCGEANPAHARFCLACGKPLAAAREMRKTVTVVFCDLIDSTPLGQQLDAETYRRVLSRYFIEVSRVLERHGGTVEKFIGDAVMAVFGIPTVHEDDALRAVRAASELREAISSLNVELKAEFGIELGVRTGIDTGEVVSGDPTEGQSFATGEAVVVAQRLEASASPGEIRIGAATYRLVRDAVLVEPLEPLDLKGRKGPTRAWRLLGVLTGAPAFARRLDSPLVGRERELMLLEQAFRRSVDEGACHLFTVLGTAGIGKSRLVNELVAELGDEARVLVGRCVPYGEGITFLPLTELVRGAGGILARDSAEEACAKLARLVGDDPERDLIVERLAAATGLGEGTTSSEETSWAVRKLLESLARDGPLVVVFDDVQWAASSFLDLVDHVVDKTRGAAILLVCLARPDLLDERPSWGGGKLNATSILLEPLRGADVEQLIDHLLGQGDVGNDVRRSLQEAGEGNPLFVEEMLAMLVDQGRLQRDGRHWTSSGGLGTVEAPPTIHALLAARIDRLGADERDLLERAAVIGKSFSREALVGLAPDAALDELLEELERKDLVLPDRGSDEAYGFRHILIRDAAYQGVAKERRAELHESLADWLTEARPDRLREYEEILGYHLEQAHRYRSELAPADTRTDELASRAAGLLASAGRRAFARGDMAAAVGLLTRATLLLRDDEPARLELAPDLATSIAHIGELTRAEGVLERAIEAARALGDERLELHALLALGPIRIRLDPARATEELTTNAQRAIEVFERLGDEAGLAQAWLRLSDVHWLASRWGERGSTLEQALFHARRADDPPLATRLLGSLPVILLEGATPVPEALERCEQILEQVRKDQTIEARTLVVIGELHAMLGDFDKARSLYREGQMLFEDLGHRLWIAVLSQVGGIIESLAGDLEAAEAELRAGYETLSGMGEKSSFSTVVALLASTVYARGDFAEAIRLADLSEANAAPEDVLSHLILRGTRAMALARSGDHVRAEEVAREAVELAERTDSPVMQADAHSALAETLRLGGNDAEAAAELERAVELYDAKGHIVARDRAVQSLATLAATR